MAFYMGIDGGGTKTTCVVGDNHSILGVATGAGSSIIRCGESQARTVLHDCIRQVCTSADIEPAQITRACIGIAGAGRPSVCETVLRILSEILPVKIQVVGDITIALQAAFSNRPGVVVIAGTGSIAYGRNQRGHIARAGGWGFAISDEGSGHWIGRHAIGAALRRHDQGEDSALLEAISQAWGLKTLDDLVRAANAIPSPDFADLVPHVLASADAGDELSRRVLFAAGTELAILAKVVISRIFAEQPNVPVAMCGGVFRNSALVRQVFSDSLRSECRNAAISSTVVEPEKGALELARQSDSRADWGRNG